MFRWFANARRKKLMNADFPAAWENIIQRNVAHDNLLNDSERARLRSLIQVFVAEKKWEGAGGLELTDEMRVTVSAQACLLILAIPHDFYPNVETIIVYPSAVVVPGRRIGFFETALEPLESDSPIDGEAFQQGPLILAWDAVLQEGRHPGEGFNIVYHEFAHKLDMLAGAADTMPPLRDRKKHHGRAITFSSEYLRLRKDISKGRRTFLNEYAATDEAEFFAVATEQFFDQPLQMIRQEPDLYRLLMDYYRQDPAKRAKKRIFQ